MINKNWIIIALAVIVAALIGGFWWYDHAKLKKVSLGWQTLYTACQNAPADTVIVYDSIIIPGKTIIKPVPYKVIEHDTVIKLIKENWYSDVFKKDGVRFNYQAHTMGELLDLKFSDFVWPKEIVTITRHVDTCATTAPPPKLFRWGLYTEMQTDNFTTIPGIGLGGQVVISEQLTLGLGAAYDKGFKGNLRFGILFK